MTAIAHDYPEEIADICSGLERFLRADIIPLHAANEQVLSESRLKYREDGSYSSAVRELVREVRRRSARAGFYAMCAPEELGGGGQQQLAYFAAWELVYRVCGMKYWLGHYVISHWAKGPSPVLQHISPGLRDRILPGLMAGDTSICFALSEPGAGSDAAMIRTRATPDGDGWRLNGEKIWISNSPHADYAVVFAVTDPEVAAARKGGISAFFVPMNSPGFSLDRVIKLWGHSGGDEGQLSFADVRIEPEQLIGKLHHGFATAMLGVGLGRVYNCAKAIGAARWALQQAVDYTKIRKTFGRALENYQGVTFPLAEAAMRVHAAHLVARNVATLLDRGEKSPKQLAMAKAFCAEACFFAVERAMQTHGAMGFTNEMYLVDAYIMLRRLHVADGSAEIMRRQVFKAMAAGDMEL